MIEGFHHRPGFHCGSTAISLMLQFYGHPISEAFCLGMGQGLGSTYLALPGKSPSRLVMTRNGFLEMNAFDNFGIPVTLHETDDPETAWLWVKNLLDQGQPAMIQADVKDLPYYHTNTRFAGHKIIVCGYDPSAGTVEISDNEFEQVQTISVEQLAKARISPQPLFDLRHNWFELDVPKKLRPFEQAVPKALIGQAKLLLDEQGLFGTWNMKRLGEDIYSWAETEDWSWSCRFAYQTIEKRGTGGGAFRLKYALFLTEAEQYCPAIKRLGLPEQMEEIGTLWVELGRQFKHASNQEKPDNFASISETAKQIAIKEKKFFETVLKEIPCD